PAREADRRLEVVLVPARDDRPDERYTPLAPELVPAVRDPVQVRVVAVVGAPGQVRPDDERGVRPRMVDRVAAAEDDRRRGPVASAAPGRCSAAGIAGASRFPRSL